MRIRSRIERACTRAGRPSDTVTLVAVGKRQPIESLREAHSLGLRVFGENQVQEALTKSAALPDEIDWHMIGPLQSNKVRAAAELFSTVHSVDRLKIARKLDDEAARCGRRPRIFLQIHLGDESTKHGFAPESFLETVRPLAELEQVEIVGLMAVPPYEEDPELGRRWFHRLRILRDDFVARPEWSHCPGWLSMGMSHDFEIAIEEGATHVRVGTSLFGSRST